MGVLVIFGRCSGDIFWVSWIYLIIVLDIFDLVLDIFDGCTGDILALSWTFLMVVLEIFDRCPGDI